MNMQKILMDEKSVMRDSDDPFLYWEAHLKRLRQHVDNIRVECGRDAIDIRKMVSKQYTTFLDGRPLAVSEYTDVEVDFDRVHVAGVNEIGGGA